MDVVVVGSGVIGLSAALRLQQAGLDVRIVTRELPLDTTSSVAAAVWYPYRPFPEDRVLGWGRRTFDVFQQWADRPRAGVRIREAEELFRAEVPEPWWIDAVTEFRRCARSELPAGYRDGFVFTTPVVEMPVYLSYLLELFQSQGGVVEHRAVTSLGDATSGERVIVNCTGMGSKELADDASLTPIRGQVVSVANPGIERVILDEENPAGVTYIVPRSGDCILGGTAEEGVVGIEPDPGVAQQILDRCVALEPRLSGARVLADRVGLRPGRPEVRLDLVDLPDGTWCVHDYGHGGAGVTLSWGCADDVVRLVLGAAG